MLVIQAVVSFRSVPKIMGIFNDVSERKLNWIPHFTSVINWTLLVGLGLLQTVHPVNHAWLAVIDHSIDIGTKKALVVLRVPMNALTERGSAIQLSDCECIGLSVSETVNGEQIAEELTRIFTQAGAPQGIIKDGDSTLNKGVRLWSEQQGIDIPVIQDIGHDLATGLKKEFAATQSYQSFSTLTTQGASRLRQTDLAFLIPPKLRSKGRFQSISHLGKWAEKILEVFAVKGRATKGSLLDKLRKAFPGFLSLKPFIKRFAKTAKVTSDVMEILKNEGMNEQNYEKCQQLAETLPKSSKVKKRLQQWLERHLAIQKKLDTPALLVSSDIIESLFGKFKHVIERSPQADMNRSVLLIPALCGQLKHADIVRLLSQTHHADLAKWEEDNIPYTMRKKRQEFFKGIESQKPGNQMAA